MNFKLYDILYKIRDYVRQIKPYQIDRTIIKKYFLVVNKENNYLYLLPLALKGEGGDLVNAYESIKIKDVPKDILLKVGINSKNINKFKKVDFILDKEIFYFLIKEILK